MPSRIRHGTLSQDRVTLDETPPDVVTAIDGGDLLIQRFGRWPDFADTEVLSLGLAIIWDTPENLNCNLFAVHRGGTGIHHDVSFTCQTVEVITIEAIVQKG